MSLMALLAMPAMATEESFDLELSEFSTVQQDVSGVGSNTGMAYPLVMNVDFNTVGTPSMLIYYLNLDGGSTVGGTSTFTAYSGATAIGTGTIQNQNGSYLGGAYTQQILLTFTSWTPGSLSGYQKITLDWTGTGDCPTSIAYDYSYSDAANPAPITFNYNSALGTSYSRSGRYVTVKGGYAKQEITITNSTPISPSMVYHFDVKKTGTSLLRIYSNGMLNYTGSTNNADVSGINYGSDLMFSMYVPSIGKFANSSIYYPYYTTVTPTPTPIPGTTPLPTGYVNTYFQCVDGNDNSRISGCNLALKDNFDGSWSNSTSDDDGTYFITTHENATVSGYATATGYLSTERTNLPTFAEGL